MAKTIGTSLLAWQDVANQVVVISAAVDVLLARAIGFNISVGRNGSTAFTANYPTFRLEASGKASGNDSWIPLLSLQPAVGSSIASTTLNGAVSAGATTAVLTSAASVAVGDRLFLGHTTTPANYELVRVIAVSSNTVTFEEPCTNAHDTGALVTSQAESYFPALDMSTYSRMRCVVDNAGNTQALKTQVLYNTFS